MNSAIKFSVGFCQGRRTAMSDVLACFQQPCFVGAWEGKPCYIGVTLVHCCVSNAFLDSLAARSVRLEFRRCLGVSVFRRLKPHFGDVL
jgi:hypothetical protein